MDVELHPQALREARAARLWYKRRSPSAAIGFVAELDHAISSIGRDPALHADYIHGTKRYLMSRYPFAVVYRIQSTLVLILAVAHVRKRPGYWTRRS